MSPVQPRRSSRCGQSVGTSRKLPRMLQTTFSWSRLIRGSEHSNHPVRSRSEWQTTARISSSCRVLGQPDLERTGWFECSDPLKNRLHENVVWSMRGNFLDVPTDCPQRDERLGWTGDINVFAPTACFLYDCAGFLSSWLADLAAQPTAVGAVPFVLS